MTKTYPYGKWLDCEFIDTKTGELFLVEEHLGKGEPMEDFIAKCIKVAEDNFEEPQFIRVLEVEEAEILGYDTY